MTRPSPSPSRVAGNVVVLLLLLAGLGYLVDLSLTSWGGAQLVSCTVVPLVAIVAPPLGGLLAVIGAALLIARRGGLLLLMSGIAIFALPDLMGIYLAPRC